MNRITQIGVVSFAKIMAVSGALMALLFGVIYGGAIILFSAVGAGAANDGGAGFLALGVGFGVAVMVIAPLFALVFYFIVGLIYALILNLVLSLAGGLEVRIEAARY